MDSRVVEIIDALLNPQDATTANIAALTEEVNKMAMSPEFYSASITVLCNPEIPAKTRDACAVIVTQKISEHLKDFPPDLRHSIFTNLPKLLVQCLATPQMTGSFEKLANNICKQVFLFADGSGVTEEMNFLIDATRGFMSARQFKAGLLLAKAIFRAIQNPKKEMREFHEGFSNAFVPFIAQSLRQLDDLWDIAAAYHCVSRVLFNALPQCFQSCGIICIDYALGQIPQLIENKDSVEAQRCVTQMLKFLLRALEALRKVDGVNEALAGSLLSVAQVCITRELRERHVALSIGILYSLVVKCNMYSVVEANREMFVALFAAVFRLEQGDVDVFQDDPPAFVIHIHGTSPEWEDKRASAGRFLAKVAEKTGLAQVVMQYVITTLQKVQENPQVAAQFEVFAACHMMSTVAKSAPGFYEFLGKISAMFQSDSPIMKAAGFLVLSGLEKIEFNPDLLQVAFKSASQDSGVVVYYAALVFGRMLENQEHKQEINAIIAPYFTTIYDLFSRLMAEFRDDRLTCAFSKMAAFFQDEIMPHAVDIFKNVLAMFTEAAQDPNPAANFVIMTSDSLMDLVDVIANHPEQSGPVFTAIYPPLCATIAQLTDSDYVEEFMKVIAEVIFRSPDFNPDYWCVIEFINGNPNLDLDSVSSIIEQLIYKDVNLAARGDVIARLCAMIMNGFTNSSDPEAPATIATSLVMRVGGQLPIMADLLKIVGDGLTSQFCSEIASLFSAIVIQCPAVLTQSQELVSHVFQAWVGARPYPLFVAAAVKSVPAFASNPEAAKSIIVAALQSLEEGKEMDDDEIVLEGDDDLEMDEFRAAPSDVTGSVIPNPTWFTDQEMEAFASQLREWAK